MTLTNILIAALIACNIWFAFLLMYDRIMETKLVRFIISITNVWKSLSEDRKDLGTENNSTVAESEDVMGKSHFKMTSMRTTAAIPAQETATSGKAIELHENDITFADADEDAKAVDANSNVQVPNEQLDDVFTIIHPSELKYGKNEPEEEVFMPRASGSTFDEIGKAFTTVCKNDPTDEECRQAVEVFTDLEGTELITRMTESVKARVSNLIDHYLYDEAMQPVKEEPARKQLVIPDDIRNFNIRDFA